MEKRYSEKQGRQGDFALITKSTTRKAVRNSFQEYEGTFKPIFLRYARIFHELLDSSSKDEYYAAYIVYFDKYGEVHKVIGSFFQIMALLRVVLYLDFLIDDLGLDNKVIYYSKKKSGLWYNLKT